MQRVMSALMAGIVTGLIVTAAGDAAAEGDASKGQDLAERFCKSCHVVGIANRHGGIGSTPSFFLMSDKLDNYRQRLQSLKRRPPHIAYERLQDVSNDDIEHLLAYIGDLKRP